MKIKEASKLLGKSEMWLRCGLRDGKLPFGTAVKTSSRWSYHISDQKLYEYLGKEKYETISTPSESTGTN